MTKNHDIEPVKVNTSKETRVQMERRRYDLPFIRRKRTDISRNLCKE